MLAIEITLLTERYTATSFNDRDGYEWPPHPGRLFSALVAAWASDEPLSDVERAALEWLEAQPPPQIAASSATARAVVTHFVPVNDASALAKDLSMAWQRVRTAERELASAQAGGDQRKISKAERALGKARERAATDLKRAVQPAASPSPKVRDDALSVLPERRGRQPRTYPSVIPVDSVVWFVWPTVEPTEAQRSVLDGLLRRVGRLGHSSTLVSCRVADNPPEPSLVPAVSGGERLRVPRPGLLTALEAAFARHGGTEPRQLPAPVASYDKPRVERRHPVPLLGGDWIVLPFGNRATRPAITRTADVARATRAALMRHGPQPPSEIISGHVANAGGSWPTQPLERPHLAVVPLPGVFGPHAAGTIFGVALVLPGELAEHERRDVEVALSNWTDANGRQLVLPAHGGRVLRAHLGEPVVVPAGSLLEPAPSLPVTLDRQRWCRPSSSWVSVTPVALDRYPRRLGSADPLHRNAAEAEAEAEAEATVARACVHAGLPEPTAVTVRFDSPVAGSAPVGTDKRRRTRRSFPPYRAGSSGALRACVHAQLTFAEPVSGPVLIGAGRYHGYGLFLPQRSS